MPQDMPPTYYEWAKMLICEDEWDRPFVYDGATGHLVVPGYTLVGNPKIGHGRDLAARGLTPSERMVLLHGDLARAETAARDFAGPSWDGLSPVRRAVLMNVAHDIGAAGLGEFDGLRKSVAAGDWGRASSDIATGRASDRRPRRYARLGLMMAADAFVPA